MLNENKQVYVGQGIINTDNLNLYAETVLAIYQCIEKIHHTIVAYVVYVSIFIYYLFINIL